MKNSYFITQIITTTIRLLKIAPLALLMIVAAPNLVEAQVPTRTVFIIAYMDVPNPFNDVDVLNQQLIDDLKLASRWHGYDHPNNPAALDYRIYRDSIIKLNEAPPHRLDNDLFDYAAVYQRFNLCALIQAKQVDEVWVWESGSGHAEEWVTTGPVWSMTKGMNVPNCGRTISSLNLNYERSVDSALHSFGHRIEGAMMNNRACDFYTETYPWTGWPGHCAGKVSDQLGFVARPFTGNNNVAVCGDIHHPPNILDTREYIYDDTTTVQSTCEDVQWDGSATVSSFNCQEWGCNEAGYMIWWMQNLPGLGNDSHDRQGNPMPSWWNYLFDVSAAQLPPPGKGTGLSGTYFSDQNLTTAAFNRIDPTVDFFWGENAPDPRLSVDNFSVRWVGQIEPAYSESYVFYVYSDDGVRLWINNQLLINNWVIQGGTEVTAAIVLTAGQRYDIRLDYFEEGGAAEVRLGWSSDSHPRQVIPKDRLYPPPVSLPNAAPQRNYQTTGTVTLTWNPVAWAAGYEVQIALNTAFSNLVIDNSKLPASALSFTPPYPLESGVYFWRVRALRSNGIWGAWSAAEPLQIAVATATP